MSLSHYWSVPEVGRSGRSRAAKQLARLREWSERSICSGKDRRPTRVRSPQTSPQSSVNVMRISGSLFPVLSVRDLTLPAATSGTKVSLSSAQCPRDSRHRQGASSRGVVHWRSHQAHKTARQASVVDSLKNPAWARVLAGWILLLNNVELRGSRSRQCPRLLTSSTRRLVGSPVGRNQQPGRIRWNAEHGVLLEPFPGHRDTRSRRCSR